MIWTYQVDRLISGIVTCFSGYESEFLTDKVAFDSKIEKYIIKFYLLDASHQVALSTNVSKKLF